MPTTLPALIAAINFTLRDPRAGARVVIGMDLSLAAGATALALVAVVSTLLTSLSLMAVPVAFEPAIAALFDNPLRLATMQGVVLFLGALLVFAVGRRFGGKGNLATTLGLMSWLEAILIAAQLAQLAALLVAPFLADLIGLAGLVLFLWLLTQFVAELHGFASVWKVLGGIVATVIVVSLGLAILLAVLLASAGGVANV